MKKIVILGSTGKIGSQTLDVIASYPKEFEVLALACKRDSATIRQQIAKFKPKQVVITDKDGEAKLTTLATLKEADLIVVALVGMVALSPTLAAIKANKKIALATKEVLVVAGEVVLKELNKSKSQLIPLDSEHSSLFQSTKAGKTTEIKNIYITMGAGPISKMTTSQMEKIKYLDLCQRKTWSLGQKIAVDSATCINKTFEIIEAKWLFNLQPEQIRVTVHPEYFCHSLVEFVDGSFLTELGSPDMRRYLQYALFYPERKTNRVADQVNLFGSKLTFLPPPVKKFPCLNFGYQVLKTGGTAPAILHGADRAAVEAFIEEKIKFTDIYTVIKHTLAVQATQQSPSLKAIIEAEQQAYQITKNFINKGEL